MRDAHSSDKSVDDLAEEFAGRLRDGERPSIEEYVDRHPAQADEIRDVFQAVLLMEELKPHRDETQAPAGPVYPPPGQAPERLGDYRIVREIGRGGMGIVYEAEQEPLGRRVAIKVLPAQLLANERLRLRFRREAQAAARLHHTNIVPVFGVGEQDGHCYYVMQLIRGKGLDFVLRDAQRVRTGRSGSLVAVDPTASEGTGSLSHPIALAEPQPQTATQVETPLPQVAGVAPLAVRVGSPRDYARAIARIGVQVAEALQYAHGQGILHRDIKPSNLLLDEHEAVWVTDFGVAKLLEEADLTQSGDLVGTLKYMPPERFRGQSEARGDIYSLGITLYEMLTLRSAFPDTTPQHLIQMITHQEPTRLRKLNPALPADLETVILKAISRDPVHRYQSAGELAEDLRRFLDDRPVKARRTSPFEHLWRWGKRNPLVSGLTAAVFTLLVAVTVLSVVAYVRTAAANVSIRDAFNAEQAQREQAENTSALALEALNRIYDRFAPGRIVVTPDLPVEGISEEGIEIPSQPVLPKEAAPLLEDLLGFYEQLARLGGDYPKLRAQAAEANHRIGDIRQRLGQFEEAVAAYKRAIELNQAQLETTPGSVVLRIKVARSQNEIGRVYGALKKEEEERAAHAEALATLAGAPADVTQRPEYRFELARTYYFQARREPILAMGGPGGMGRGGPGGFGGGMGPGRPESPPDRPDRPEFPGPGPGGRPEPDGRPEPPPDRFEPGGRGGRGSPRDDRGTPRDDPAQKAIALLEELAGEYPAVPDYRHLLACVYRDTHQRRFLRGIQGANPNEKAAEILRQLVKDFPGVPDYRFDLCLTLGRIDMPRIFGGPDAGRTQRQPLDEALAIANALVTEYPSVPQYAVAQSRLQERLGLLLLRSRQMDEAEKALRKAATQGTNLVKRYPEQSAHGLWLAVTQISLSRVLVEKEQWKEARTLLESATGRQEKMLKSDEKLGFIRGYLAGAYRELSQVLNQLGETSAASDAARRADELRAVRGNDGGRPSGPRGNSGGRRGPGSPPPT